MKKLTDAEIYGIMLDGHNDEGAERFRQRTLHPPPARFEWETQLPWASIALFVVLLLWQVGAIGAAWALLRRLWGFS